YLSTVPRAGDMLNPTYREKVTTFSLGEDKSRFTSPHFYDTPNYLMHRREMDTTIGDDAEPVRMLFEIQSDLHSAGNKYGYSKGGTEFDVSEEGLEFLRYVQETDGITDVEAGRFYANATGEDWSKLGS